MMSHPPIPIMDLAAHIDDLKVDDNLKFSSEYESIEPGQQFTWYVIHISIYLYPKIWNLKLFFKYLF